MTRLFRFLHFFLILSSFSLNLAAQTEFHGSKGAGDKLRPTKVKKVRKVNSPTGFACFIVLNDTINPNATEGEYEGCAPFVVKARNCSDGEVSYNFNYTGQFLFYADSTFVYETPGSYTLAQYRGPGIPILEKTIRVYDFSIKPSFKWFTCGKKLHLEFDDPVFSSYSFFPNTNSSGITIPAFPAGQAKVFEYEYPTADGLPFSFSVKSLLPSTCNKDLVSDTVTLYASPLAPKPDSLIGIGQDTLSYRASIGIRAHEEFAFQQAGPDGSFSGLAGIGRAKQNNPAYKFNLQKLNGSELQGGQVRAITRKRCGTGADTLLAAPHWTVFWPQCEPENQKIKLSWPGQAIEGLNKFQIYRDGILLASPSFASGTFLDSIGLICGQAYTYHFLTEVNLAGGQKLIFKSAKIEAKAISNRPPSPIENFTASVKESGIEVNGKSSPLATLYHLFRKEKTRTDYREIGNGFTTMPILDSSAEKDSKAYCYRIAFDDKCGNRSLPSDSVCPVLLSARMEAGAIDFAWTSMDGWKNGPQQYELIRKAEGLQDEVRYTGLDLDHRQAGQDKESKVIRFQVKINPNSASLYPPSYSNEIELIQESRLRCPDAFTPNNQGPSENEFFRCYGSFIKDYELRIYNSWGNVIYNTDKFAEGWDGKIDGQPAPSGNYAYRVIATDSADNRMEKSGFFALIR